MNDEGYIQRIARESRWEERRQRGGGVTETTDLRTDLVAALHREDLLGRAIHEERYAAQVPSWGPEECSACQAHADSLIEAVPALRALVEPEILVAPPPTP